MHKIKLILLLILPLSVFGQDLGIIDTRTTKNPAINGTHRIATDGKNLFFRNFFGLSKKVANTDSAVFTGTTVLPSNTTIGNVSATELSYLDGVTSPIQTQLNSKQTLNGTGFVKASGTTISYDNSTYLTTSDASSTYAPIANPTFTGLIKLNSGANNIEIDQTQIMFRRTTGTTMNLANYRAYGHYFFTGSTYASLSEAMSINNYGQVNIGNQILDGIISPTRKFQVGATGSVSQRIVSQSGGATIELSGATGGTISNSTGNLNYTSAGSHIFDSKVTLPDSTRIGVVSPTELSYLDGVTSSIQTQLGNKQPQLNGTGFVKATGTTISYDNSTYLSTSSAASTYLPISNPTATGTLTAPTISNTLGANFATSSGNVGVGIVSPIEKLDVFSTGSTAIKVASSVNANFRGLKIGDGTGTYSSLLQRLDTGELKLEAGFSGWGGFQTFHTNGVERMRILSNGLVGINTTSPIGMLDIKFDTNQHIQFVANVNGTYSGASGIVAINDANTAYTPMGFYASNYFFGSGNVGIGTTAPASKLHVYSTSAFNRMQIENTGNFQNGFRLNRTGGDYATDWEIYTPSNSTALNFFNGANRMTMFANGRVGINTTTDAGYLLDVNGNARFSNSASTGGIEIGQTGLTAKLQYNANGNLDITPRSGYNTIFTNGNVGIGTTAPISKLHVNGAILSDVNTNNAYVLNSTGSNYGFISTNGNNIWSLGYGTNIGTLATPALSWNASGNIGIGTTAPAYKTHIFGAGEAISGGITNAGAKGASLYIQDSGGAAYNGGSVVFGALQGVGSAIKYEIRDGTEFTRGDLSFQVRPSIYNTSLTTALQIQSTGNVGIGTTIDGGDKLQVNGNVKIANNQKLHFGDGANANGLSIGSVSTTNEMLISQNNNAALKFNVGFSSSSNNVISFTRASSIESMRIDGSGNVGIGTTAPAASAILDITSTTQGVLFPRLTTDQINAIASPANGLTVYNTDLSTLCFYHSNAWKRVVHLAM